MRVRILVSGFAAGGFLAWTVVLVGCAKHADFLEMRNQLSTISTNAGSGSSTGGCRDAPFGGRREE